MLKGLHSFIRSCEVGQHPFLVVGTTTQLQIFTPNQFALNLLDSEWGLHGLCPTFMWFQGLAPGQGLDIVASDEG